MALNRKRHLGRKNWLSVAGVNGSNAGLCKSGDPGVVGGNGGIAFVVTVDEDADGMASTDSAGVYALSVTGPVVVGEELFWHNATRVIDGAVGADGERYGNALEAIAGATVEEIEVKVGR